MSRLYVGLLVGALCIALSAFLASTQSDKWGWFLFVGFVISGWSLERK